MLGFVIAQCLLASCGPVAETSGPAKPPPAPDNVGVRVIDRGLEISWKCVPGSTHHTLFWGFERGDYRNMANDAEEELLPSFPADFLVKLDRGELKPDDLQMTDEEALDVLTKIHLVDEGYFTELVSLMIREDDLRTRAAEEAFDRIHQQVGDMTGVTEEAEAMFVPLDE